MNKKKEVILLGMYYMVAIGCATSCQSIINYLFDIMGLEMLGQKGQAMIAIGFAIGNIFSSWIISAMWEIKYALFMAFNLIIPIMLSGLHASYCYDKHDSDGWCRVSVITGIYLTCNFLYGIGGSCLIYICQYKFIDRISRKSEKQMLFSYFYMMFGMSDLFGQSFNLLFFTLEGNPLLYYILIVTFILLSSTCMLITTPKIAGYDPHAINEKLIKPTSEQPDTKVVFLVIKSNTQLSEGEENVPESSTSRHIERTLIESLQLVVRLLRNYRIVAAIPLMIQFGMFFSYTTGYLYTVVVSLEPDASSAETTKTIALVMMGYAIASSICSRLMALSHFNSRVVIYLKLGSFATVGALSFIMYGIGQLDTLGGYWTLMASVILNAFSNAVLNVLLSVYLSTHFEGKEESYLICRGFKVVGMMIFLAMFLNVDSDSFALSSTILNSFCFLISVIMLK